MFVVGFKNKSFKSMIDQHFESSVAVQLYAFPQVTKAKVTDFVLSRIIPYNY